MHLKGCTAITNAQEDKISPCNQFVGVSDHLKEIKNGISYACFALRGLKKDFRSSKCQNVIL